MSSTFIINGVVLDVVNGEVNDVFQCNLNLFSKHGGIPCIHSDSALLHLCSCEMGKTVILPNSRMGCQRASSVRTTTKRYFKLISGEF